MAKSRIDWEKSSLTRSVLLLKVLLSTVALNIRSSCQVHVKLARRNLNPQQAGGYTKAANKLYMRVLEGVKNMLC